MEERVWFLKKLWYLVGRETRTFNIKLEDEGKIFRRKKV